MIKGKGLFIWQLDNMLPAPELAEILAGYQVDWVAIKLLDLYGYEDGDYRYNRPDTRIREYIDALREKKISVGGWGYTYPEKPGPQGAYASERIEKFDLDFWFVNAEKEWKKQGLGDDAELHMKSISHKKTVPVLLCSYRYPELHAPFPFAKFLHNCEGANPQVYWMGSHNPGEQLFDSAEQYAKLLTEGQMFVPIGAAFGEGKWVATPEEITKFEDKCEEMVFTVRGYYSLDYILKHNRMDFMNAIFGAVAPPPPPPPSQYPTPIGIVQIPNEKGLNVRSDMVVSSTSWVGVLAKDAQLYVFEKITKGKDIWLSAGSSLYIAEKYAGKTYVKWL
jgi:hypothetical protein